jgi:NAD(P)-dependent dehydrogenase (short-subunit alcohol dehydrogenase family)
VSQDFSDKVILVTGGASGIGYATCAELLARGARVALWDIDMTASSAAVRSLDPEGKRCRAFTADVGCGADVESALSQTLEVFGALHGAFNNAGIGGQTIPLADMSETDFDAVLATDLKGVWLCLKHELLLLRETGGAIVNNASVAGLVALAGQSAYVAAKHGVIGLTKTAAVEYAEAGVRVNAVCPGAVQTPILKHLEDAGVDEEMLSSMSPQARIGRPVEVANAVCWLLSDEASFVTGAALSIDGGWAAQ